jgi:GntR family transcriptional regulator
VTELRNSEKNKGPLYIQIQETLKEMIDGADFVSGDQIPSERELADKMQVSRMTARRAVESLIEIGILERRSTSGTFVREPKIVRNISSDSIQSLTRQIQGEGGVPGSKLLSFKVMRGPKKVSEFLNLRVGMEVYCIKRLRLTNNVPFCIETSYLPFALFPDLTREMLSGDNSLYQMLAASKEVKASKSIDTLKLTDATTEEANLLEINVNDPVFLFQSILFDESGNPFEYVKSINHPYRVVFKAMTQVKEDL